jgi:hypothetical protein
VHGGEVHLARARLRRVRADHAGRAELAVGPEECAAVVVLAVDDLLEDGGGDVRAVLARERGERRRRRPRDGLRQLEVGRIV